MDRRHNAAAGKKKLSRGLSDDEKKVYSLFVMRLAFFVLRGESAV